MNTDKLQHVHVVPVIRSYAEKIGRFLDLGKLMLFNFFFFFINDWKGIGNI